MHKRIVFVLAAALFSLPGTSAAMPAISCHCFQNREFDPRQPAAADEYLLATTFNSFQALALGIDKKSIVRARMSGTTSDELWLQHWLAKKTGQSADEVLQQYRAAGSWLTLARNDGVAEPGGGDIATDRELAQAIARSEMIRIFDVEKGLPAELAKKGSSLKEMTLSLFIAAMSEESADRIFYRAQGRQTSWGLIARKAGITFSAVETEMKKLNAATPQ